MTAFDVGAVEDFPDRTMKLVEVNGLELGVCRWGGEFFGVRNVCPHQGAPVCRGFLQSRLLAQCSRDGMELEATPEEPVILCSWHRWEFSLRSGESAWDPRYKVKTYRVDIDRGRVVVQVGRG